jgi:Tol biopolymer transport system component
LLYRSLSLLALALALAFPAPLPAQFYGFGKNKIQYDDFKWEVLSGEHVDLYYYPEERELALIALDYAEESYRELERKFSYHPQDRIPLVLYASHAHFEQTNILPFFIPEGVAGFTEFLKGRVALPFNGSYADFRHVIRHELVHVFQARKATHEKRLHPRGHEWPAPQWFSEGLAEYWSSSWSAEGDLVVRDLLLNGRIPEVAELDRYAGSFAVYKLGQNLLEYLGRTYGDERLVAFMESQWKHPNFATTFRRVYGVTLDELDVEWKRDLRQRYFPQLAGERPVATSATPVVTEGRINVNPAIVPAVGHDGETGVAYLSLQSGYATITTADLAGENENVDAEVVGDRSGEYESFHPLQSALDVSHDGRLAFVAKAGARDVVYVRDLATGDREARRSWEDLVALSSPSWAPDGRRLAFVGLSRAGYADLYVWDLEHDRLDRLTNDRYLEATPSWSPTRDEIVFASDRTPFGQEGSRNLYLIDIGERDLRPLTFGRWVDRDPDWSPDGTRVVFASDRGGTLDLYVADREGAGYRATSFAAGAMHPRWHVRGGEDEVVFTAYENLGYDIYRSDLPASAPTAFTLAVDPTVPQWRWEDVLPDPSRFVQRPYAREFGLDFAGAALAFTEDGGRGEGAQIVFSDLLGDHLMYFQVNSQSDRTDLLSGFTGVVSYVNLKRRLNWGVSAYRLRNHFVSLLGSGFDRPGGNEGLGIRDDFFEERFGGSGIVRYPISKFQRVEGEVTLERNDLTEFDDDDPSDNFLRDAWLSILSASWVVDNTLWGPTGPVDGQRMNVTLAASTNLTQGGIESTDLLVDARKYFRTSLMTTLAVRLRARGSRGDIPTFYFLGGPSSLRGYPRFVLNGSQTLLLNQEWRFPLLRPNPMREGPAVLLANGIWGALFVDLGNAWVPEGIYFDAEDQARRIGNVPPGLLGSYGFSLRYPLAGPFILRFDWARRFDLDDKRDLFPGEEKKTHFSFFLGYNY